MATHPLHHPGDSPGAPLRVLIAERGRLARAAIRVLLEREEGIRVVATGDEAVGEALRVRGALVLVDSAARAGRHRGGVPDHGRPAERRADVAVLRAAAVGTGIGCLCVSVAVGGAIIAGLSAMLVVGAG